MKLSKIIIGTVVALVIFVGSAIQRLLAPLHTLSEVMVYNHETGDHMKALR